MSEPIVKEEEVTASKYALYRINNIRMCLDCDIVIEGSMGLMQGTI